MFAAHLSVPDALNRWTLWLPSLCLSSVCGAVARDRIGIEFGGVEQPCVFGSEVRHYRA